MSVVASIHNGRDPPVWVPWDGTSLALSDGSFAWIDAVDCEGIEIGALQTAFGLHDLAVEDSMSSTQVAKVDLYSDHVFILAKAAELDKLKIRYTDVGIFLGEHRVITVCRTDTAFGKRMREGLHRITLRQVKGPEFVVHDVLDRIVDGYFPVLQMITEEILRIEKRLLEASLTSEEIARIFKLRRETVHFQHSVTRMMDVCSKLVTLDIPCVSAEAKPYFRDVLDNLMRVEATGVSLIDVIRTALEASSLLEQQRQSSITRQLAAWASILGVPTAIAGIYGMNFVNMPETRTSWGYFAALGGMGIICTLLYRRFRRLGWLQRSNAKVGD